MPKAIDPFPGKPDLHDQKNPDVIADRIDALYEAVNTAHGGDHAPGGWDDISGTYQLAAEKSQPNGIASLDADGKHPMTEVPDTFTKPITVAAPFAVSREIVPRADILCDYLANVMDTTAPHKAYTKSASSLPSPYESGWTEFGMGEYGDYYAIASPGDITRNMVTGVAGNYAFQLFMFDVLGVVREKYDVPHTFSVTDLKRCLNRFDFRWTGYGKGSNGGAETFGATITVWSPWKRTWNEPKATNTSTSPSTVGYPIPATAGPGYYLDSNGCVYFIVYNTHPSDGTISSVSCTDYVKLDVVLKDLPLRAETTITTNFEGKTVGDAVTVPHVAKYAAKTTFDAPDTFANEFSYTKIQSVDGVSASAGTSGSGYYDQNLFSFDLLTVARRHPNLPDDLTVEQLKAIIKSCAITWVGYGVGSDGGAAKNGSTLKWWNRYGGWVQARTGSGNSIETLVVDNNTIGASWLQHIDENGVTHILVHSTYPSDGTIASQVWTDYIEVEMTLETDMLVVDGRSLSKIGTGACIKATTRQSIPNAANTPVAFDTVAFDTQGMADVANNRLVIQEDGVYIAIGRLVFILNATGERILFMRLNDSSFAYTAGNAEPQNVTCLLCVSTPFVGKTGDYIDMYCKQSSGESLDTWSAFPPELALVKVG